MPLQTRADNFYIVLYFVFILQTFFLSVFFSHGISLDEVGNEIDFERAEKGQKYLKIN